ncbi:MAG: M3 family metallopeptidase [Alphaproteobacteria bacterium]|nr:M3 family metallopeptidase [Alphaproteobacteria bacterium]
MSSTLVNDQQVPAYGTLKIEDIKPAFGEAIDRARKTVEALKADTSLPDFSNIVAPFDTLFSEVEGIYKILNTYFLNARTAEISDLLAVLEEEYDSFSKAVYQDSVIAARFKAVYDARHTLDLDDQDLWFLENQYAEFKASGSVLPPDEQKRLKEIDSELICQAKLFNDNLEAAQEQQSFLVDDAAELAGLPDDVVSSMAEIAKEAGKTGWLFVPERLFVDRLLGEAENREFRRKILAAMDNIGKVAPFDNVPVIAKMQQLRHERATLLGYESYAQNALDLTMAGSVDRVLALFDEALAAAMPVFEQDMKTLQDWVTNDKNGPLMEPWDVAYYTALYKKETFNFDEAEFSQYLELENVIKGWFMHDSRGMNIEFTSTDKYPVWHPDVRVFETFDRDSGKKGLLYMDLFARKEGKEGGAWMDCLQVGEASVGHPNIISFNMNLTKPEAGKPVLLSIGDVETFYHEGGHCLNGIKGTKTKYRTRNGTANSSDFVEIHSMIDENWGMHPDVLATYAFHYQTGASIPPELLKAREASNSFMASADLLRLIQNARRDMVFHSVKPEDYGSDAAVEAKAALSTPYSNHVRPYPLTRFSHLFSSALSAYAAGYYGYFFSDIAQAAAFETFAQQGIYDPDLTARKREFYAAGGGQEPNAVYRKFTGFDAGDPAPLLVRKGIISAAKKPAQPSVPLPCTAASGPEPSA